MAYFPVCKVDVLQEVLHGHRQTMQDSVWAQLIRAATMAYIEPSDCISKDFPAVLHRHMYLQRWDPKYSRSRVGILHCRS